MRIVHQVNNRLLHMLSYRFLILVWRRTIFSWTHSLILDPCLSAMLQMLSWCVQLRVFTAFSILATVFISPVSPHFIASLSASGYVSIRLTSRRSCWFYRLFPRSPPTLHPQPLLPPPPPPSPSGRSFSCWRLLVMAFLHLPMRVMRCICCNVLICWGNSPRSVCAMSVQTLHFGSCQSTCIRWNICKCHWGWPK